MTKDQIDQYFELIKKDSVNQKDSAAKSRAAERALKLAEKLVGAPVTKSDAQGFMDRAEKYARNNPEEYFKIYVRFAEVQERFQDNSPKVASAAFKRATEAFEEHRKNAAVGEEKIVEKIVVVEVEGRSFDPTEVFNPPATGSQTVPDRRALSAAMRQAKSDNKEILRARGDDLLEVPRTLLNYAEESQTNTDLAYAYAMLAAEVAAETEDLVVIDDVAKWMIGQYSGLNYHDLMKDFLSKMRTNDAAKSLVTLLQNPDDPEANMIVGLHYALKLKQRKLGWNLLVKSESVNKQTALIGKMELSKPTEAFQQKQLADQYLELAEDRKIRRDTDLVMGAKQRAIELLKKAQDSLKGVDKKSAQSTISALEKELPVDITDINWKKLDLETWKLIERDIRHFNGKRITVDAKPVISDTRINLGPNDRIRIVPAPAPVWDFYTRGGIKRTNPYVGVDYYDGDPGHSTYGKMVYSFDKSGNSRSVVIGKIISGPGRLYLHPGRPSYSNMSGKGLCPTLIIPILEE